MVWGCLSSANRILQKKRNLLEELQSSLNQTVPFLRCLYRLNQRDGLD